VNKEKNSENSWTRKSRTKLSVAIVTFKPSYFKIWNCFSETHVFTSIITSPQPVEMVHGLNAQEALLSLLANQLDSASCFSPNAQGWSGKEPL
jgi:hypothetical protein